MCRQRTSRAELFHSARSVHNFHFSFLKWCFKTPGAECVLLAPPHRRLLWWLEALGYAASCSETKWTQTAGRGGPRKVTAHRHAVLLAKQLHPDLVHVGGDVPLRLLQVFRVSLHQGFGDPTAAVLRGAGNRKAWSGILARTFLSPRTANIWQDKTFSSWETAPEVCIANEHFLHSQDVLEGILLHLYVLGSNELQENVLKLNHPAFWGATALSSLYLIIW